MSSIKIEDFAKQIGIGADRLVKQLADAGVLGKSTHDILSDKEKRQLLDFLRGGTSTHTTSSLGRISLKKKTSRDLNGSDSESFKKEIKVHENKRITFVKREELEEQEAKKDLAKAIKDIEVLKSKLKEAEQKLKSANERVNLIEVSAHSEKEIVNSEPKVFISYSYDSPSHKKWVKGFAKMLVGNGVDAILDQWALHPGDSITEFMKKSISEADYVLIICTEKYKEKSDQRIGGVGFEEAIISSDIFEESRHRKYIPILRSSNRNKAIPLTLGSKVFLDLSNEDSFDRQLSSEVVDLLLTIFNKRPKAPPLGNAPDFNSFINE